ncbi:MAG: hypothetical protein QOK40_1631 [Miltoncostaeaceae bacterium]|jgi:hypothetical protein|nr:hypothetical protein [Miltoncostaeaceae bacterium]
MATCQIYDNPDVTAEDFERLSLHVRSTGPMMPEGARLLVAGPTAGGWRVVTVWDSDEALQRFVAERLVPAYEAAGLSLDNATRTSFDVHTLVAGDLVGTPA